MNNRGNNDFVEEKCAPVRRGGAGLPIIVAPLPVELKPKFPKTEEAIIVEAELAQTPQAPVEQVQAAAQSPIVEAPAVMKTLETEVNEAPCEAVSVEAGSQQQEDADKADAQQQKKKKKVKKPARKDTGTAVAVFVSDDEDKKDDPNNAIGQFVEDDDVDKKKNKKKEKKEKMKTLEKEKDSNQAKDLKVTTPKVKKDKAQKTDRGSARQKGKLGQSNRQKRQQRSARKSAAVKPESAAAPAVSPAQATTPQVPAGKNYVPLQNITATLPAPTRDKNKATGKDATEGFLKTWISKAKQKYVGKNPSVVEPSTLTGDDSIVAPEPANIKPEVTAVYGGPCDYAPKTMPTNKSDKSHPDKLFPGGRPFWMSNNEKPPPTKVITARDALELYASGKVQFLERQTSPPKEFTPYSEDLQPIRAKDEEYFADYRRVYTNTLFNLNTCPGDTKDQSDKPKSSKNVFFKLPTTTTIYKRKDQSGPPQKFTSVSFQPCPNSKGHKMKKKKSSPCTNSASGQ